MERTMTKAIDTYTPPTALPPTSGKNAFALSARIARLKQIAGEAMDHLILSDGPPQPDYELLDVCSDLLHLQKHANAARKIWRDGCCDVSKGTAARAEADALDAKLPR
jgi:hypothetical protein